MKIISILVTIFLVSFLVAFIGYNTYMLIVSIKNKKNEKGGKN